MKNTTLSISIATMILLSTFVWSCKEDPLLKYDEKVSENYISSTFTNPYDSIGIAHNIALDEFINNKNNFYQICDSADFINGLFDEMSGALCRTGYHTPPTNCDSILEDDIRQLVSEFQNYNNFTDFLNSNLSVNSRNKLNELIGFFDMSSLSLNSTIDSIEFWEEEVNNSSVLNSSEKITLLKAGSVGRYSLTYWYNKVNDSNNNWVYNAGCTSLPSPKLNNNNFLESSEKWKEVAKADVKGAVVGWLAGGNALTGALVASTAEAIDQFWDDIWDAGASVCDTLFGWI